MRESMSNLEYQQWRGFFEYRHALEELEVSKATAKAGLSHGR